MNRMHAVAVVLAAVTAGCSAHDAQGRVVRTGHARFDAQSVSSPKTVYTLESDGTWAGLSGDRYERVGDAIRKVGAFSATPSLIRPSAWVQIERLPNGVMYTPSYLSAPVWTFVTEDGKPLPEDLEVSLYLAARLGLGGQWARLWGASVVAPTPEFEANCGLILIEVAGRNVAGWVSRQGAVCPAPLYPPRASVARAMGGEVWTPANRPAPF